MRGHSVIEDGNWVQVTGFLRARDASMHMMAQVQSPDGSLTKAQVMGLPPGIRFAWQLTIVAGPESYMPSLDAGEMICNVLRSK